MKLVRLLLLTVLLLQSTQVASAQHFGTAGDGTGSDLLEGCGACHDHHGSGSGRSILKVDGELSAMGLSTAGPGDLDEIASSCLRCHATPERRGRQPEFRERGVTAIGKYLELEMGSHHPIGRAGTLEQSHSTVAAPGTWGTVDRSGSLLSAGSRLDSEGITCNRCHDPHERAGIRPDPDTELAICTGCHDPGIYVGFSHGSLVCSDCHQLHGGRETDLVAEQTTDELCQSCHDPGRVGRYRALQVPPPLGHLDPPAEPCSACHQAH